MAEWMETGLIFLAALIVAWLGCLSAYWLGLRALGKAADFWRSLLARTRGPVQLGMMIIAVTFAANVAPLPAREGQVLRQVLLIALIACIAWIARTALEIWTTLHLRRFRIDVEDNLLARKHITQSRILQRVASGLIVATGVAAALMTIDGVRQYGVSLLASAGAAGIVLGIALQPVLRNIFAGIQLALTQPIRIDDAVIVEGEWGNIEEITSTYVVIRLWDKRRLVVPLNYFIEQPFQNWTRNDSALIGTVMLYVDYQVSIPDLRAEAQRVVQESSLWDRDVFVLQVTEFREARIELRVLASARSAPRAFDLRCEIREKLLAYLQSDQQAALPRTRTSIVTEAG